MSSISFCIRRKQRLLSWLGKQSLEKGLSDKYSISLETDGRIIPVDICGEKLTTLRTDWGDKKSINYLVCYLKKYRQQPESAGLDSDVCEHLHRFLFAGNRLDTSLAEFLPALPDVYVKGGKGNSILVNIPWELANGIAQLDSGDRTRPLLGTLASLPLARLIEGTNSAWQLAEKERLRILYCISQPAGASPINADGFHRALELVLRNRAGMLSYKNVLGANFSPSFDQLRGEIVRQAPHIFIMIGHGRTTNGRPEVLFGKWTPTAALADTLATSQKTFLVLLISCDQAFLDEGPSAHSGALLMLQKGIPAVVAMQSSINAVLAGDFLGTMVDQFLQNASLAKSVAAGRIQMAPGKEAKKYLDWSFPSLFFSEDAPRRLQGFADFIEHYIPSLEQMLRSIPLEPSPFFSREELSGVLAAYLRPDVHGLRYVYGGYGVGKTSLAVRACRDAVREAIERRDSSFRPILYVNLELHPEQLETIHDLMHLFSCTSKEIQIPGPGATLLSWPLPRGADGGGQAKDSLRQLIKLIDENRMVLVIDHFKDLQNKAWVAFLRESRSLLKSLVILISDVEPGIELSDFELLRVPPLNSAETQSFVQTHMPHWDSLEAYSETGGILLLLNDLKSEHRPQAGTPSYQFASSTPQDRIASYVHKIIERATKSGTDLTGILYLMVHFPHGVNGELASLYVANWLDLLELAAADVLVQDFRFGENWLRLPGLVLPVLRETSAEEVHEAGLILSEGFVQAVSSDDEFQVENNLLRIARLPGGTDFLHDIHRVFIDQERWDICASLPLLLHSWLFKDGRWFDAYKLWDRFLRSAPRGETEAFQWLYFGKSAHLLGKRDVALDCLATAKTRPGTRLDAINMLDLEASIIKDSGQTEKKSYVMDLYDNAMTLIQEGEEKALNKELGDYRKMRAQVLYNRAIFRRWWMGDIGGELCDLEEAGCIYQMLGMGDMQMVAKSEWVDMQLDEDDLKSNWIALCKSLFEVDQYFETRNNLGDRALCNYRIAQLYHRMSRLDEKERTTHCQKAYQAFSRASDLAQRAGDLRLQQIAEGHLVEIGWGELSKIKSEEAVDRLGKVTRILEAFQGDAWSTRVLRDMLRTCACAERELSTATALTTLRKAWSVATQPPLHPALDADAHRAARIFSEYVQALADAHDLLAIDAMILSNAQLLEKWLGKSIEFSREEELLAEINKFGNL